MSREAALRKRQTFFTITSGPVMLRMLCACPLNITPLLADGGALPLTLLLPAAYPWLSFLHSSPPSLPHTHTQIVPSFNLPPQGAYVESEGLKRRKYLAFNVYNAAGVSLIRLSSESQVDYAKWMEALERAGCERVGAAGGGHLAGRVGEGESAAPCGGRCWEWRSIVLGITTSAVRGRGMGTVQIVVLEQRRAPHPTPEQEALQSSPHGGMGLLLAG